MRTATLSFILLVILVSVSRPVPAQDAQTPSFRAGVEALPVDVSVVDDKGQPVRELLATDFTVRIEGRARKVTSAQWIASDARPASPAAAAAVPDGFVSNEAATGGRLMAIVVDQPNIQFGEMRPIRDALYNFIDRLSAAHRVAVIGLGQPS